MHLNRVVILAAVSKSSLTAACLFLALSLTLCGCGEAEKAKETVKEKSVVTEMNIKTPDAGDSGSAEKKVMEPKKDAVESLPMESDTDSSAGAAAEEELPMLGTGG